MPSSLIHLTIADLYAQSHRDTEQSVTSLPDFMLGCIAPDSVNIGKGMAPQEVRYAAHLRSRDIGKWLENIHAYRMEHEAEFADRPDMLRGVLMHFFTDIAWDERVQPALFDMMFKAGVAYEDRTRRKWEEMSIVESYIRRWSNAEEALAELKKAQPRAVTTVTAEQVAAWQQEVLRRYEKIPEEQSGLLDSSWIFAALHRAEEHMQNEYGYRYR